MASISIRLTYGDETITYEKESPIQRTMAGGNRDERRAAAQLVLDGFSHMIRSVPEVTVLVAELKATLRGVKGMFALFTERFTMDDDEEKKETTTDEPAAKTDQTVESGSGTPW